MPYLLFVSILTLFGGLQLKNTVVQDTLDQVAILDTQQSVSLISQLEAIKKAIVRRQQDALITDWECLVQNSTCTNTYERIVLDDGYVTESDWQTQLIPDYLPAIALPEGWSATLLNKSDYLRICFQSTSNNKQTKTLLMKSLSHNKTANIIVSESCDSDVALTSKEISENSLPYLYLQTKMKKTL